MHSYLSLTYPIFRSHWQSYLFWCYGFVFPELLQHCEELYNNYVITVDQAELAQKNTQEQAKSKVWFQQKSGHVTASRLKSVSSTDVSQPSLSLVKEICYPDAHLFYSRACSYGCKYEEAAWKEYVYEMKRKHIQFSITESGLVLDPLHPFWVQLQMELLVVIVVEIEY